jgi:hypothetical protein
VPFSWQKHAPVSGGRLSLEVDEGVVATIAEITETESKFGGVDPTLTLELDDGSTVTWYARPASARAGLAQIDAQVGDRIHVRRLRDVETPNGRAHRYEVESLKADATAAEPEGFGSEW